MTNAAVALRERDSAAQTSGRSRLVVEPVTPVIGAELSGVDLSRPLDAETLEEVKAAIRQWRVVFFRDQDLSNDELIAWAPVQFRPRRTRSPRGSTTIRRSGSGRSTSTAPAGRSARHVPLGRQAPRDYKGWHIDITFVANPNRFSILYGTTIPPYGGDTIFSNLVAAYEGLSPKIKALVDDLKAVHQTSSYDEGERKPRKDGRGTGPFVSLHPLVRIHPETGERVLFFNAGTVTHIAGLKERENHFLLELLFHEITRPEYQARFRWRPNSLVVWDNAAVSHAGPIDYAQFSLGRTVRRITVAGDLPEGPDGFRSQALEGELFNVLG